MKPFRRFLLARSLGRLIQKERGAGTRAVQGYFSSDPERVHYVSIDADHCHLVLSASATDAEHPEERTEVPRSHAEALLDVCAGKVAFDRIRLQIGGGRDVLLDRFMTPGPFDLLTVEFEEPAQVSAFSPPAWFGPEVTGDAAYENRAIALNGIPAIGEVPLSNSALESLLDVLENRFAFARYQPPPKANPEVRVAEAFRRLAAATPPADRKSQTAPAEAERRPPGGGPEPSKSSDARPAESMLRAAVGPAQDDTRIDNVLASLSEALGQTAENTADVANAPSNDQDRGARRVRRAER